MVTCILCFSWTHCVSRVTLNSSSCFYLPGAKNNGLGYHVCFYVVLGKCWTTNIQTQIGQFWNVVVLSLTAYHEIQKEFLSSEVHRNAFVCRKPILKIRWVFCNDTVLKYFHVLFQFTKKLALKAELPLPAFKTQSILSRCILQGPLSKAGIPPPLKKKTLTGNEESRKTAQEWKHHAFENSERLP